MTLRSQGVGVRVVRELVSRVRRLSRVQLRLVQAGDESRQGSEGTSRDQRSCGDMDTRGR